MNSASRITPLWMGGNSWETLKSSGLRRMDSLNHLQGWGHFFSGQTSSTHFLENPPAQSTPGVNPPTRQNPPNISQKPLIKIYGCPRLHGTHSFSNCRPGGWHHTGVKGIHAQEVALHVLQGREDLPGREYQPSSTKKRRKTVVYRSPQADIRRSSEEPNQCNGPTVLEIFGPPNYSLILGGEGSLGRPCHLGFKLFLGFNIGAQAPDAPRHSAPSPPKKIPK